MNGMKPVGSGLVSMLALGLMAALAGCTGAGVPVGEISGNQPGETPSGGNAAPGSAPGEALPPGNSALGTTPAGNTSAGNGSVSSGSGGGSLTPGVPYPMPQPGISPGVPYPMPQPNMPAGILGFLPPDGVQICPTPRVVLALHLTDAIRKDGAFDPSKVTLTLDGQNILSKISLIAPMIYPQSQVTLTYVQGTPLALGAHQVKFTYPSPGGPLTLTWNFTVANIPCQ